MVRKISWHLQELAMGGLSDRAKARLVELAESAPLRHVAPRPTKETGREEAADDGRARLSRVARAASAEDVVRAVERALAE